MNVYIDSLSGSQDAGNARASGGTQSAYQKTKLPKTRRSSEWSTITRAQESRLFMTAIFGGGNGWMPRLRVLP